MSISAIPPSQLPDLTRAQDRITFAYVERCVVGRDSGAITVTDKRGVIHLPGASLGVLLAGPGATITHPAMMLLSENASTVVWAGEQGVRYYAHGRTLTTGTGLLQAQAQKVSNRTTRLHVARAMYQMRFPGEDVFGMSMQQLRGREGARVRRCYREHAERTGVPWEGRRFNRNDFSSGSPVNQALSVANSCLYGVVHAVIVALGVSPSLGFVHTGHELSFVHDIADLYKSETTIPAAFDIAAGDTSDVSGDTRRMMREYFRDGKILHRCVSDIKYLLTGDFIREESDGGWISMPEPQLWDDRNDPVQGGTNYGDEE